MKFINVAFAISSPSRNSARVWVLCNLLIIACAGACIISMNAFDLYTYWHLQEQYQDLTQHIHLADESGSYEALKNECTEYQSQRTKIEHWSAKDRTPLVYLQTLQEAIRAGITPHTLHLHKDRLELTCACKKMDDIANITKQIRDLKTIKTVSVDAVQRVSNATQSATLLCTLKATMHKKQKAQTTT